jgi:hypothetical protein
MRVRNRILVSVDSMSAFDRPYSKCIHGWPTQPPTNTSGEHFSVPRWGIRAESGHKGTGVSFRDDAPGARSAPPLDLESVATDGLGLPVRLQMLEPALEEEVEGHFSVDRRQPVSTSVTKAASALLASRAPPRTVRDASRGFPMTGS